MMNKFERNRDKILQLLNLYGKLSVADVVRMLQVSEATVRRLFVEMERANLLLRFHGGIRSPATPGTYSFNQQLQVNMVEKQAIGRIAAALVHGEDRIFLDSGTTTREFGAALTERLATESMHHLRVVTNSLAYTDTLARKCQVLLTGGMIDSTKMELSGAAVFNHLQHYHFTKAFFGTDGISEKFELMTSDDETSQLIRLVVKNSDEVIVLADSSKINRNAFVLSGLLNSAKYTLITDANAPGTFLRELRKRQVKVMVNPEDV